MADPKHHPDPALGQRRILFVDDKEMNRIVLGLLLQRRCGWEVSTAARGKTALEMIRAEEYDLVLLDDLMPGKDGFATCTEIREVSDVPIVMFIMSYLSSHVLNAVRAFEAGADGYVFKPCTLKRVVNCVTTILEVRPNAHTFDESGWGTFKRK